MNDTSEFSIVLAADCGGAAGWGHFTRCLALGGELAAIGAEVVLGVCGTPLTSSAPVPVVHLARSELDEFLCEALAGSDLVVLDLCKWDEFDPPVADRRALLAWISDRSTPGFAADIGIDPNVSAVRVSTRDDGLVMLEGSDHIILRKQFDAPERRVCAVGTSRVLVGFGGTEQAALTDLALGALALCGLTIDEITIVTGESPFSPVRSLPGPRVRVVSRVDDMKSLFEWADLGVLAAGTMLVEACTTGLPSIVVSLNEDQAVEAAVLAEHEAVIDLGRAQDQSVATISAALRSCVGRTYREQLAGSAQALIDGNGRTRVARALIAAIENAKAGVVS